MITTKLSSYSNLMLIVPSYGFSILLLLSMLQTGNANALSLTSKAAIGYVYGFPIVLMDETLQGLIGPERSCSLGADINTFTHVTDIPDAHFKAVVRPNVDTLYSSAMLDLSSGPQLLDMPAVDDRYVLMALLDAWSNNFAGLGTQTHGIKEGKYAIVGPNWRGYIPREYKRIEAPTNLVWIIGRTEVLGEDDIATVNAIQQQYSLSHLRYSKPTAPVETCVDDANKTPPIEAVKALSGEEFFTRLSTLVDLYPPNDTQAPMTEILSDLGVGADAKESITHFSRFDKQQLNLGITAAQAVIDAAITSIGFGGWGPNPDQIPLGDYDQRYFIRAVVAQVGFGANQGKYAVYQNNARDDDGARLDGNHTYTFTLNGDNLPPVDAFWSITAYGEDGFLARNSVSETLGITRSALGSNSQLEYDDNGNITLYISATPPEGIALNNWIPVPNDLFQLTLRFYAPGDAILSNTWQIPSVIKQ